MKKTFLLAVIISRFINHTCAQPGQLDYSFGTNGIVKTELGKNYNYPTDAASKVLSAADGSIYVLVTPRRAGTILFKRHSDGSSDTSFGYKGATEETKFSSIKDAALQSDGKIVTAGVTSVNGLAEAAVARYNTDGSLDSSFSEDGKQATNMSVSLVAIQKDGRIIVTGLSDDYLSLARYNTDGSPDSTFNGNGLLITGFYYDPEIGGYPAVLSVQSDGKIVVGGGQQSIVRYNADGSRDDSFYIDKTRHIHALTIQSDGKLVALGHALTRHNINGSLDKSFSDDGIVYTRFEGQSLALQSDGKIVMVYNTNTIYGTPDSSHISRYNSDGTLDKSFSDDGKVAISFTAGAQALTVAIQSDGKIVVGGGQNDYYQEPGYFALARYNTNGSSDNTFNKDGTLISGYIAGNTVYTSTVIQKDGKIAAAGNTWNGSNFVFVMVRYNTDGSLDNTFSDDGMQTFNFPANQLALLNDGKFIAAGGNILARINADGSIDKTFGAGGMQTTDPAVGINRIALQNDGKIVAVSYQSVARYNSDGSADKTFGTNGKRPLDFTATQYDFNVNFTSLAIQKDGKIVLGGVAGGIGIVRLNTDGSTDSTFSDDGLAVFDNHFNDEEDGGGAYNCSVVIQNDGKIVTKGDLEYYGISLDRLNTDGSVDSTFKEVSVTGSYNDVNSSIALQSNGKILVGGYQLLRYNIDGSLDDTFNINAIGLINFTIKDIAVSNNNLYVAGGGYYGGVARYLLDNASISPIVSITAPADNATYLAPAAYIRLRAATTDSDGTITKVEFYNGTALLHTETVIPYGYNWKNVPVGNYTLTAKAYDNSGNITTSAPVHISVVANKPPAVSIISPANNQVFAAPATIRLEAAASDTDGRITRVEFYKDSTLLGAEYKYPYTYNWKNVAVGTYVITAKATDNFGAQTISAQVSVTVTSDSSIVSNRFYSKTEKPALKDALRLRLSPNPASNTVNIFTEGLQLNKPATISIISISGNVLKTMQISKTVTQLDVSTLASEVYTIKIISGDKIIVKQFVKL